MKVDFSKSLGDISIETGRLIENNGPLLERQRILASGLNGCPPRQGCVICGTGLLAAERFNHRGIEYAVCPTCGHVQTGVQPPRGYPYNNADGITFDQVYPRLGREEFISRRDRIYGPKLDWILHRAGECGATREQLLASRWVDIGCGAGYFIGALAESGVSGRIGLEENEDLVSNAKSMVDDSSIVHFTGTLADALRRYEARVYTAFYVLEHIEDSMDFFIELGRKPPGTIFAFAVPTLGFSTVLEGSFDGFFARNLDSVLHTQLYTEESIRYAVEELAGFEIAAQWIFGQDAADLYRALMVKIKQEGALSSIELIEKKLGEMMNGMQEIFDRQYFSDSRHVLAVKK